MIKSKLDQTAAKVSTNYDRSHELVNKGNSEVNGPYLDDIKAEQEGIYRENRVQEEVDRLVVVQEAENDSEEKEETKQEEETDSEVDEKDDDGSND